MIRNYFFVFIKMKWNVIWCLLLTFFLLFLALKTKKKKNTFFKILILNDSTNTRNGTIECSLLVTGVLVRLFGRQLVSGAKLFDANKKCLPSSFKDRNLKFFLNYWKIKKNLLITKCSFILFIYYLFIYHLILISKYAIVSMLSNLRTVSYGLFQHFFFSAFFLASESLVWNQLAPKRPCQNANTQTATPKHRKLLDDSHCGLRHLASPKTLVRWCCLISIKRQIFLYSSSCSNVYQNVDDVVPSEECSFYWSTELLYTCMCNPHACIAHTETHNY